MPPIADLAGLLVVPVEQAVAAPLASARLAAAGARVIKVERPEGDFARSYADLPDGASAYFVWANGGKESIRLDLRDPDDAAVLRAMVAGADVFIENLAPGAIERLGFDPAELRARHPRLITCSISGYGTDGPLAGEKAYDMIIQAEAGLASITGDACGPARVGISVCDIAAGVTAFGAILQSLIARERTGVGRHVDVSLFAALADWMNVPYLQHAVGGAEPSRPGLRHPSIAPYGVFTCADGVDVLLSIQNEREWRRLCADVLDDAALADDPRFVDNPTRVAHRAELDAIVSSALAADAADVVIARLRAAGIACGRVSTLADLATHPQAGFVTVETDEGPVRVLEPGFRLDGEAVTLGPVPALGCDDDVLRREFGPASRDA